MGRSVCSASQKPLLSICNYHLLIYSSPHQVLPAFDIEVTRDMMSTKSEGDLTYGPSYS